jgi:hypothetical protein
VRHNISEAHGSSNQARPVGLIRIQQSIPPRIKNEGDKS